MPNQCTIPNCHRPRKYRLWCNTHYQRWWRLGAVDLTSIPVRFWSKVTFTNSCWLWTGYLHHGYGSFNPTREENVYAHRWAYEFCVGTIPNGLQIDHLCRVRNCVNPDHLEAVTPAINASRSIVATKTHCIRGHEFTEANTFIRANGTRRCRTCQQQRLAARRQQGASP